MRGDVSVGISKMKTALLMLLLGGAASPVMAEPHDSYYQSRSFSHREGPRDYESRRHAYHHDGYRPHSDHPAAQQIHSHVTCDMVRSYVPSSAWHKPKRWRKRPE
jgi:hypothetical protein